MRNILKLQIGLAVFLSLITVITICSANIQLVRAEDTVRPGSVLAQSASNSSGDSNGIISETTLQQSYYVYNVKQESVIKSVNEEIKRAPASTTKILTGLVVWEALNTKLDETITVGNEVIVDGSGIGLQPGDQITVRQLLTAMYVASANDAAAALAVKSAGSMAVFADRMNQFAISIGCIHSHFTNPHGLPDLQHYSTARDLAKISIAFIKNPTLLGFVSQPNATVQWKDAAGKAKSVQIHNTNKLLGVYPDIQGLKTGTTTEAGQCLIAYYQKEEGEYLFILLGAKQRYQSILPLIDETISQHLCEDSLSNFATNPYSLLCSPGLY